MCGLPQKLFLRVVDYLEANYRGLRDACLPPRATNTLLSQLSEDLIVLPIEQLLSTRRGPMAGSIDRRHTPRYPTPAFLRRDSPASVYHPRLCR